MVAIPPVVNVDVQIAQCIGCKGVPEVGHEFRIEITDLLRGKVGLKDAIRPAAQIENDGTKRFVHGDGEVPKAADARLVAQCFTKRLSQTNAHVLDRVMLVHIEIAPGRDVKVHCRMLGQ